MEVDFDEAKSRRNLSDRGFDYDYAARIFTGPVLEREDRRLDYGERRIIAIGQINGDFLVVVYTRRGDRLRINSARPANRNERNAYRQHVRSTCGE